MNERHDKEQEQVRAIVDTIMEHWAEKGKVLEGGWQSYLAISIPPEAPDIQKTEMRRAYFLGAQHLFAALFLILDPGQDKPTEKDMKRLVAIKDELDAFVKELKAEAIYVTKERL